MCIRDRAIPYPVCLTIFRAFFIWSYSLLATFNSWNNESKSALVPTVTPMVSFSTWLYNPAGASRFIVTSPVAGSTSDIYDFEMYSDSVKLLFILSMSFSLFTSVMASFILVIYSAFI